MLTQRDTKYLLKYDNRHNVKYSIGYTFILYGGYTGKRRSSSLL